MLPVFMSKIIISVMDKNGINFMLLSTWILFAQVMVGIMMTGPGLIEERESKTFDALLISLLGKLLFFESLLLPLWMTVLALWIWRTGKE
jgi:ABC-2 type transport system permease protein